MPQILLVVGLSFISENMWRVTKDDENWTLSGFEIIFPMLIEKAKDLGINIPLDDPTLEAIYAKRELKLTKYVPFKTAHARSVFFFPLIFSRNKLLTRKLHIIASLYALMKTN